MCTYKREVAKTQRLENFLTLGIAPNVGKSVHIIGPAGSISEPNTYCPVPGCGKGNDQKDTIVSHIKKEHKDQKELIALCNQQAFLKCKICGKVFSSVKGKNQHEDTCGLPKTKKNCPFEKCFKTYQSQERMDQHVATAHEGKGHKCLCPVCGTSMSSQQFLDNHLKNQHNQE